jgi:hypothetical protein
MHEMNGLFVMIITCIRGRKGSDLINLAPANQVDQDWHCFLGALAAGERGVAGQDYEIDMRILYQHLGMADRLSDRERLGRDFGRWNMMMLPQKIITVYRIELEPLKSE